MSDRHMSPDEFRRIGRDMVDWLADYMERVEGLPVLSLVKPGEVRAQLPNTPPAEGEDWDTIRRDLEEIILPGITHWQSPRFFAFFNGNTSGPSVLGELVAAGLGPQGMLWATSPAVTELETHVLDWLADMSELPERFTSRGSGGGVIQDTASTATLIATLAARERATEYTSNDRGLAGGLTAYTSAQAHSSVEKAVRLAGIGSANLRLIDTDAAYAMRPAALAEAMDADRAAGLTPAVVVATVGTTSSLAMDPIRPIGEIARSHGAWYHIDAAWAGTAAICPEFRYLLDGVELADSYLFNPHKWMFTNVDCDAFYVADRAALVRTMSVLPEYLRNEASASGEVWDYRDWQIALGRRFRALKLWFVIRHYGVEGLRELIRLHVSLAQLLATWVAGSEDFDLAAPHPLTLVCFRHRAGDEASQAVLERVNASGEAYLSHTRLDGSYVIRANIGQTHTEEHHVAALWELLTEAAREVG